MCGVPRLLHRFHLRYSALGGVRALCELLGDAPALVAPSLGSGLARGSPAHLAGRKLAQRPDLFLLQRVVLALLLNGPLPRRSVGGVTTGVLGEPAVV